MRLFGPETGVSAGRREPNSPAGARTAAFAAACAAILVLAVPAAASRPTSSHHHSRRVSTPSREAPQTVYGAPWPSTPIETPDYVYVPGGPPAQEPAGLDACTARGEDCTAEELCELWGEC